MCFSQRRLRSLAAALVYVAVVFLAVGCGQKDTAKVSDSPRAEQPAGLGTPESKPPAPQVGAPEEGPKLALSQKDITLRWVDNGSLRMSAKAKEFRGSEVTKTGELLDFSAQLYEDGKPVTTITAPRVVADTANRIVTATGGVLVKSLERNTVVKAEWIKWYAKNQKIVGNGGVSIKSDVWDAEAAAFVADTALKTVSLRNSAKGL